MRRKILILIGFFVLSMVSMTFAYNYDDHLGGNNNFILCDGHMGTAWYVDRSSLVVEKYEPPQYIISVNVCTVNQEDQGNTAISNVRTYRYFYNWDLRQMYVDRDGNSNWWYLDPRGSWAATGVSTPAGEIAFALAYNKRFYGAMSGYDDNFYSGI